MIIVIFRVVFLNIFVKIVEILQFIKKKLHKLENKYLIMKVNYNTSNMIQNIV